MFGGMLIADVVERAQAAARSQNLGVAAPETPAAAFQPEEIQPRAEGLPSVPDSEVIQALQRSQELQGSANTFAAVNSREP